MKVALNIMRWMGYYLLNLLTVWALAAAFIWLGYIKGNAVLYGLIIFVCLKFSEISYEKAREPRR